MPANHCQQATGGVTAAHGFRAAAIYCGIKAVETDDLAMLVCDAPTPTAAATFTTNRVAAAPVQWTRDVIRQGAVRAVVVNSGNANACTGERGLRDAQATAAAAAQAMGLDPTSVAVCSTGKIGRYMPIDKLLTGIPTVAAQLDDSEEAGDRFAHGIMTTDTVPKQAALRCDLGDGATVTLGGATKGAGMIAPNMATTLTFVTTDATIARPLLLDILRRAVAVTYNRITIDQHTSTNDTLLCLASGLADAPSIEPDTEAARRFEAALAELTGILARKIVLDGEGATRLVRIDVEGAPTEADALAVARAIADSPLAKCAFHSGDPNWGRFVSAAGYACAAMDEAKARLYLGDKLAYEAGAPADTPTADLAAAMGGKEVVVRLDLGLGTAAATVWTCDLSKAYIDINAEYHV